MATLDPSKMCCLLNCMEDGTEYKVTSPSGREARVRYCEEHQGQKLKDFHVAGYSVVKVVETEVPYAGA